LISQLRCKDTTIF